MNKEDIEILNEYIKKHPTKFTKRKEEMICFGADIELLKIIQKEQEK